MNKCACGKEATYYCELCYEWHCNNFPDCTDGLTAEEMYNNTRGIRKGDNKKCKR